MWEPLFCVLVWVTIPVAMWFYGRGLETRKRREARMDAISKLVIKRAEDTLELAQELADLRARVAMLEQEHPGPGPWGFRIDALSGRN